MIDPTNFTLNSNFKYPKLWKHGTTDTSSPSSAEHVLVSNVPDNATWIIGHYVDGIIDSGRYGVLKPNGDLVVAIQRQVPVTTERWHWRVYVS